MRHYDFTTITRSSTRAQPTDDPRLIAQLARKLLADVDTTTGIRLLGVGVTTLADFVQDDLFTDTTTDAASIIGLPPAPADAVALTPATTPLSWRPGQDVHHDQYGPGWVWGSGLRRVSVRFEGSHHPAPGPVRTFAIDDVHLRPAEPAGLDNAVRLVPRPSDGLSVSMRRGLATQAGIA